MVSCMPLHSLMSQNNQSQHGNKKTATGEKLENAHVVEALGFVR